MKKNKRLNKNALLGWVTCIYIIFALICIVIGVTVGDSRADGRMTTLSTVMLCCAFGPVFIGLFVVIVRMLIQAARENPIFITNDPKE